MQTLYMAAIFVITAIFGALNFYIGLRGWQAFSGWLPPNAGYIYWPVFFLAAFSYPLGRFGSGFFSGSLGAKLQIFGSYWLGLMYYLIIILVVIDLIRVLDKFFGFVPQAVKTPELLGLAVVVLVAGILIYGTWNAHNPQVVTYDLEINKPAGAIEEMKVVMVSDIHLGTIVHNSRLSSMVDTVNSLEPDLVLLPGDIIDENINPFIEQKMAATFLRLAPRFGTYAVLGNHEYIGGHVEATIQHLREANIILLRDQKVLIEDSFYIVGRDEQMRRQFNQDSRLDMAALLEDVDQAKPIIVMSHQPVDLDEAEAQGADLQVSGHTHLGQLSPNQLVTRKLFEIDYGYLKKDTLQVIVSSGFGTWGPPIRIGNTPEIVQINIKFNERAEA
ncbi:MAG: metallophosphoesterase [Syntrophomonadaceae bacterium]|nr:metallophosphoesterase [Syntrophomonadaceae bacterium]